MACDTFQSRISSAPQAVAGELLEILLLGSPTYLYMIYVAHKAEQLN